MSNPSDAHAALLALDAPPGDRLLGLRLGAWNLVIEGLDEDLSRNLGLRWGGFAAAPARD